MSKPYIVLDGQVFISAAAVKAAHGPIFFAGIDLALGEFKFTGGAPEIDWGDGEAVLAHISRSISETKLAREAKPEQADPFSPKIAWRRRLQNPPKRDPVEIDVQDGRAEYILSGPYKLGEGATIKVVDGKVLWGSGPAT